MAILFNFANPTTYSNPLLIGQLGQSPGGSTDALPNPTTVNGVPISSALEIQSTTSGLVHARMTTAQKLAIVTPAAGLEVFDTTIGGASIYNGATWTAGGSKLITGTIATPAALIAIYATPLQLVPAPPVGFGIIVNSFYLEAVFGSAAFTGGGPIIVQYGNTIHGAGTNTIVNATAATIPAAFLTTFAANQFGLLVNEGAAGATASANITAAGVFLSNTTNPFVTGTGASFNYALNYTIVPMV